MFSVAGNTERIKLGDKLFFTLNIYVANFCRFLLRIGNELSFSSSCSNDESWSCYTNLSDLSCKLFILLLSVRLRNIQIKGQYENCDSINAFMRSLNLL